MVWPAIIAGAASIAGNTIGSLISQGESQQNRQFSYDQLQWQRELADRNERLQREFAQQGIRWKVADAQAAGIHPLYAMGASTPSFSNLSFVPGEAPRSAGAGQYFSQMGQDISRAALSMQNRAERAVTGHDLTMMKQREESGQLDIDIKRAQLLALNSGQLSPPRPMVNSSATMPAATPQPGSLSSSTSDDFPKPYVTFVDVGNGLRPMPHKDLKVEDEFGAPLMAQWGTDVHANPYFFKPSRAVIEAKFGRGAEVVWSPEQFQWRKATPEDYDERYVQGRNMPSRYIPAPAPTSEDEFWRNYDRLRRRWTTR